MGSSYLKLCYTHTRMHPHTHTSTHTCLHIHTHIHTRHVCTAGNPGWSGRMQGGEMLCTLGRLMHAWFLVFMFPGWYKKQKIFSKNKDLGMACHILSLLPCELVMRLVSLGASGVPRCLWCPQVPLVSPGAPGAPGVPRCLWCPQAPLVSPGAPGTPGVPSASGVPRYLWCPQVPLVSPVPLVPLMSPGTSGVPSSSDVPRCPVPLVSVVSAMSRDVISAISVWIYLSMHSSNFISEKVIYMKIGNYITANINVSCGRGQGVLVASRL